MYIFQDVFTDSCCAFIPSHKLSGYQFLPLPDEMPYNTFLVQID